MRPIGRLAPSAALVALIGGAVQADLAAQDPDHRAGQWIGVGLGGGLDQIACEICSADPQPGIVAHVRVGGTASSRLLLGGELGAWIRSADETRQYLVSLGAVGPVRGRDGALPPQGRRRGDRLSGRGGRGRAHRLHAGRDRRNRVRPPDRRRGVAHPVRDPYAGADRRPPLQRGSVRGRRHAHAAPGRTGGDMALRRRSTRAPGPGAPRPVGLLAALVAAGACGGGSPADPLDPPAPSGELGTALGRWSPGPFDTCSREIHDSYATVGPDGKLYPTWHPAVDPATGCTFGHEHGRDPRGSEIHGEVGDIAFGYANERLDIHDPLTARHEDHVGHKIEWENDVRMRFSGPADAIFEARCHVLVKLHQGSHSKDAFTNNLHELVYHARCDDGTATSFTILAAIGRPGEFVRSCDSDVHVTVGPPTPLNSPSGGGQRRIPDRACVEAHALVPEGERSNFSRALRESWQLSERLRRADGRPLVSVNPYFNVFRPSRFYDPARPDGVGRPIDVCYETVGGRRARGAECEDATGAGQLQRLTFDDPRSPFDGAHRDFDMNSLRVMNAEGPTVWYTDPFGQNAATSPFPGSIRQFVARIDNTRGGAGMHGPAIGRDRHYGGPTVHAPN